MGQKISNAHQLVSEYASNTVQYCTSLVRYLKPDKWQQMTSTNEICRWAKIDFSVTHAIPNIILGKKYLIATTCFNPRTGFSCHFHFLHNRWSANHHRNQTSCITMTFSKLSSDKSVEDEIVFYKDDKDVVALAPTRSDSDLGSETAAVAKKEPSCLKRDNYRALLIALIVFLT